MFLIGTPHISVFPIFGAPAGAPLHQDSLELVELQAHVVHVPLAPLAPESRAPGSRATAGVPGT